MDFMIDGLDIVCILFGIVCLFLFVNHLRMKAIYGEVKDFRAFVANEFVVAEAKITDLKHEVKHVETNLIQVTSVMLDCVNAKKPIESKKKPKA